MLDFSLAETDSALEITPSLSPSLALSAPFSDVGFDGDSDFGALSFSPSDIGFCFSLSAAAALRMIFIVGALGGGVLPVDAAGLAMLVNGGGLAAKKISQPASNNPIVGYAQSTVRCPEEPDSANRTVYKVSEKIVIRKFMREESIERVRWR
jgi:hypothetical protein